MAFIKPSMRLSPGQIVPVPSPSGYQYQYSYPGNLSAPSPPPPAHKAIEPAQKTETPLVGFRAWRVQKLDGKYFLQSTYKDTIWPHRHKMERGVKPPDCIEHLNGYINYLAAITPSITNPAGLPISDDYSLGIHAIKEKHKLGELCVNYDQTRICGEIYMWGEVTETEHGYLAQYAYPKQLWVMSDMDPTVVMELEDSYGVPVLISEAVEMAYKSSLYLMARIAKLEQQLLKQLTMK